MTSGKCMSFLCLTLLVLCGSTLVTTYLDKIHPFTVHAQVSGCPSWTRTSGNGWTQGSTVYINFGNITDSNQRDQIKRAVATWNTENQNNNSKVKFSYGPPPSSGSYTLTFQNGATPNGDPGLARSRVVPETGNIIEATITFNTNATFNGNPRVFQPGNPGYDTIFEKIALHEIGHTMGLAHPEPNPDNGSRPRDSVMNVVVNPNDSGNNLPTSITTCDRNSVNSQVYIYSPPVAGGGGGSFNPATPEYDTGGGGCTHYYWVYYRSYNGGQTWQQYGSSYAGCW